jgi:hypothetical protein
MPVGGELNPTPRVEIPGPTSVSPVTKPDQFGQVYDAQKDVSSGKVPSAAESNRAHSQSDVDSSPRSQHHTLGKRRNQASPGDHIHDGISSPKLGARQMDPSGNVTIPALVLTGSKGGNVALTNLIAMLKNFVDFTDNTT